jgi:hypothetical protein
LSNCFVTSTPIEEGIALLVDMQAPIVDPIKYHTLVGKILCATQTCCHITLDVNYVFCFMHVLQVTHLLHNLCSNIWKIHATMEFVTKEGNLPFWLGLWTQILQVIQNQKNSKSKIHVHFGRLSHFMVKHKIKLHYFILS